MKFSHSQSLFDTFEGKYHASSFAEDLKQIHFDVEKTKAFANMVSFKYDNPKELDSDCATRDASLARVNSLIQVTLQGITNVGHRIQLLLSHSELRADEEAKDFESLRRKLMSLLPIVQRSEKVLKFVKNAISQHETEMVGYITRLVMFADPKSTMNESTARSLSESGQAVSYLLYSHVLRGIPASRVRKYKLEVRCVQDRIHELQGIEARYASIPQTLELISDASAELQDRLQSVKGHTSGREGGEKILEAFGLRVGKREAGPLVVAAGVWMAALIITGVSLSFFTASSVVHGHA